MKIVLGTDHGGFEMKEEIKAWLEKEGYEVVDMGAKKKEEGDDFVDYAEMVVEEVIRGEDVKGVLFCRNGFGMVITANRYLGIRCGLAFDERAVVKGRNDDDINCLAIPADYMEVGAVKKMIEVFLKTEFSGEEKYVRRIVKIDGIAGGDGCCGGGCEDCC